MNEIIISADYNVSEMLVAITSSLSIFLFVIFILFCIIVFKAEGKAKKLEEIRSFFSFLSGVGVLFFIGLMFIVYIAQDDLKSDGLVAKLNINPSLGVYGCLLMVVIFVGCFFYYALQDAKKKLK